MHVKIKRGRLKDLSQREQTFLQEGRPYFAEDVGGGVVITIVDNDATLLFYMVNSTVERFHESRPDKPLKEYIYS